jgi:hypothetical protein
MTPAQQSAAAAKICALAPVVPVLVIDDLAHAAPLARALVAASSGARLTATRCFFPDMGTGSKPEVCGARPKAVCRRGERRNL